MAKVTPYYTSEPETPEVYHDDDACPHGQRIKPEHLRYGTGARDLCSWCEEH